MWYLQGLGGGRSGFFIVFRLVGLVVGIGGLATAAFPAKMSRWRVRGPGGTTSTVEPSGMRLLFSRFTGLIVAVMGFAFASGVFLP